MTALLELLLSIEMASACFTIGVETWGLAVLYSSKFDKYDDMNGSIEACLVQSIVYISNLLKTSITAGSLFDLLRMAISPQTKASRHQIKVLRIHAWGLSRWGCKIRNYLSVDTYISAIYQSPMKHKLRLFCSIFLTSSYAEAIDLWNTIFLIKFVGAWYLSVYCYVEWGMMLECDCQTVCTWNYHILDSLYLCKRIRKTLQQADSFNFLQRAVNMNAGLFVNLTDVLIIQIQMCAMVNSHKCLSDTSLQVAWSVHAIGSYHLGES